MDMQLDNRQPTVAEYRAAGAGSGLACTDCGSDFSQDPGAARAHCCAGVCEA